MKVFIIGAVILLMYGGCCSNTQSTVEVSSDSLKVDTTLVLSQDSSLTVDTTK